MNSNIIHTKLRFQTGFPVYMPGILLYCNGMKPKFKIKLQYDKKNNIWAAITIILAVVMYVTIDFSIVALIAYGFLYYLVKSLHLELDDRCP